MRLVGNGPDPELLAPPEPVPYNQYWTNLAAEQPHLRRRAHEINRNIAQIERDLLWQPDIDSTEVAGKLMSDWHRSLGGHNEMFGAEAALERAFSITYQAGALRRGGEAPRILTEFDPLDISTRIGVNEHKRSRSLEVSAELMHDRLWLEPDDGKFEEFSGLALNLYGAVLERERSGHFDRWERALRHQYDIAFGFVHKELRQLASQGWLHTERAEEAMERFELLQLEFGRDFIDLTETPGALTGHLFEWLFTFVYRNYMLRKGLLADHELRTGLVRHDRPLDKLRGTREQPKQATDCVIVKHKPSGPKQYFVQCKMSDSGPHYSADTIKVVARLSGVANRLPKHGNQLDDAEYDKLLIKALREVAEEVLASYESDTKTTPEEIDSLVVPLLRVA